ncbi:Otu domain-containing protein, partial [Haematococcus lacustris]
FRSLSDQLYGDADHHTFVRQQAVLASGASGQVVQLQMWDVPAAADHFGLRINVLSSYPDTAVLTILPESTKSQRVLWLSFWAEVHYNSLYPRHDPPVKAPSPSRKILGSKMLGRLVPR